MKAHELGSAAITGALIRSNVRPEEVSDVIMGQVSVKNIAALEIEKYLKYTASIDIFSRLFQLDILGAYSWTRAKSSSSSCNERSSAI